MAPALIRDVDRERRQSPVGENGHQLAGDDVGMDDVQRLNQDAEVGQRRRANHLTLVRIEYALDGDRLFLRAAREMQHVRIISQVVDQHVMPRQRIRRHRRAAPGQIAGRCGQHASRLGELAHRDAGIRLTLARADSNVDARFDEVRITIRRDDLHVHVRIALMEFAQRGCDVNRRERHRRRHAQCAGRIDSRLADCCVSLGQLGHDGSAAPLILVAGICQPQAARGSLNQPRGQSLLERVQTAACRSTRHPEPLGGFRKTAGLGNLQEKFDLCPFVHLFDFSIQRRTKLRNCIFFSAQEVINVTPTIHRMASGDNRRAQHQ
ncbi:hypothetical protein PSAC2689_60163 [Paraburkholderia sacchari]